MRSLRLALDKGKLFTYIRPAATFDTIDRHSLCSGVSSKVLSVLRELLDGTTARVWCREGDFDTETGGCVHKAAIHSVSCLLHFDSLSNDESHEAERCMYGHAAESRTNTTFTQYYAIVKW